MISEYCFCTAAAARISRLAAHVDSSSTTTPRPDWGLHAVRFGCTATLFEQAYRVYRIYSNMYMPVLTDMHSQPNKPTSALDRLWLLVKNKYSWTKKSLGRDCTTVPKIGSSIVWANGCGGSETAACVRLSYCRMHMVIPTTLQGR